MATLIICPACDTRYETKAVFPPEGRKVRCSKCGHVWQAHPVTVPPPAKPVPMTPPPPPAAGRQAAANAAAAEARRRGQCGTERICRHRAVAPSAPPRRRRCSRVSRDAGMDADLAAQLARLNAEAMADTPPAAPPEKSGGIFARLSGKRAARRRLRLRPMPA